MRGYVRTDAPDCGGIFGYFRRDKIECGSVVCIAHGKPALSIGRA